MRCYIHIELKSAVPMERTGVARIFLEDARWYVGKRVENFTTNNFRLYFFEKKTKLYSGRYVKSISSKEQKRHIPPFFLCVSGALRGCRQKQTKRAHFLHVTSKVCKISRKLRAPLKHVERRGDAHARGALCWLRPCKSVFSAAH